MLYTKYLPVACRVLAFNGEQMVPGAVLCHTEDRNDENGLTVRLDTGETIEYGYSFVDMGLVVRDPIQAQEKLA